jgi:putative hydrolase of the HAD superfamily
MDPSQRLRAGLAVLVDIGGVLCSDGLRSVTGSWSRRLGIAEQSLRSAIYAGSDEGVLIGRVGEEAWWRTVADRLGAGPGLPDALRSQIASAGAWDEQLLAFVRGLRGRARTALVSNAWPHLRIRLTEEHLDDVADEVILSCEVGYAKPDARIYQLALSRLGVTPGSALFIDDTPGNVAAAVSAGLRGHLHTSSASTVTAIERFLAQPSRP